MLNDIKKNNKLTGDKDFVKENENTNCKGYFCISLLGNLMIIYELCK